MWANGLASVVLSSCILKNKNQYYINLRNVTEKNDWESWILYMLEDTAQSGRRRIEGIDKLMITMGEEIQKQLRG